MLMKFKYEKEFREAHPETTGEKDSAFDLYNYTEWLETIVSRVELPVSREIYDRLLYYCWCVRFEKDEDFMLTKTHDAYKEFLTQTETHDGDCTLQAVSCMRCHLQACEIEAQKLYNYLCGK